MFLIPTSTVRCAQCSRRSGRIVNLVFVPETGSKHPVVARGISNCGDCGGRLYFEAEVKPSREQAAFLESVRAGTAA